MYNNIKKTALFFTFIIATYSIVKGFDIITNPPEDKVEIITEVIYQPVTNNLISSENKLEFTENDIKCLARNIYYEGRGEKLKGQIAIANVTINRIKDNRYPTTVCEVVNQPYQFSWTINYKRPNQSKVDIKSWRKAIEIAELALNGKIKDITDGATHYHERKINPDWANSPRMEQLTKIGNHIFYRESPSLAYN